MQTNRPDTHVGRNNSQPVTSFDRHKDRFSRVLARLVRRSFPATGSICMCLLLISICSGQAWGNADAGTAGAAPAIEHGVGAAPLSDSAGARTAAADKTASGGSFFSDLFQGIENDSGKEDWRDSVRALAFRLTCAAILGAIVAFRPRRSVPFRHRNPYVVQTQILLSVVACALMMIVGDSAARAFGIFAAASLIRFRTSIRDPKETTVLLINLGIGLAAGVGRWELAAMFTVFVMFLLRLLESYEAHQPLHSMKLSVRTHDVKATDGAVRELLRRNKLDLDLREFNKESAKHPLGKVVYSVDVSPKLNTDQLAAEIYSADAVNIDKVEWHRKKTPPQT